MFRPLPVLFLLLVVHQAACAGGTRNLRAPSDRVVQGTAYTLDGFDTELAGGLVGLDLPETGLNLAVRQGVGGWAEARLNVGHASFGVLSAGLATTLIDTPVFAAGFDVSLLLARPRNIWLLPSDTRDELEDVTLAVVPFRFIMTFPFEDWLLLTARVGYDSVELNGTLESESSFLNGGAGARQAYVDPEVHVQLGESLVLSARAHIPYWARGQVSGEAFRVLTDGVRAGSTTVDWGPIPRTDLFGAAVAAEWWWDNRLSVHLALARNVLSRTVVDIPVLPSAQVSWRF